MKVYPFAKSGFLRIHITKERLDLEYKRILKYATDWIFILLIGAAIYRILQTGDIFSRIVDPLAPHAYRVIFWAVFSLLVLRKSYQHKYLLAFSFYYALSEAMATTYYVIFHQYWAEFANGTYVDVFLGFELIFLIIMYFYRSRIKMNKYLMALLGVAAVLLLIRNQSLFSIFLTFPIIALIMFFIVEPEIKINKYIVPFLVLMLFWSLLGFHVEDDVCCSPIPPSSPLYQVPLYINILDAVFLLTYLFWIYGCNLDKKPLPTRGKRPEKKRKTSR